MNVGRAWTIFFPPVSSVPQPFLVFLDNVKLISLFYVFYVNALLQIHANCRIRRVYFSDRLYSEDELPAEFKLYLPVQKK